MREKEFEKDYSGKGRQIARKGDSSGEPDHTAEYEDAGGFGGDPDENFFRGEIIYEDPEMILKKERSSSGFTDPEDYAEERFGGFDGGETDEERVDADCEENDEEYDSEEDAEFYHDPEEKSDPDPKERKGMKAKSEKQETRKAKKRRKKKSFLWKLLRLLVILAAIVLIGLYLIVHLVYGKMNYSPVESVKTEAYREDGVTNILLIGNDSRENGEDGRSDAMILLSISNKTKTIQMTSLLRDMYVEIPGHDGNRLNAAYAYGGAELLMETIEQNLGISVNRYVLVNFEAFANLVDAVGGVDLELTNDEVQYVNGYLVEYNMLTGKPEGTDYLDTSLSGMIHLNGPQALAYTRNRYIGTDFGRTERQRKVLSAVIKNLPKSVVTNPKGLVDGLLPNLTTNLTSGECYTLGLQAGKLLSYEIVQGSVPIDSSYQNATIRGMAVLQVDFDKNREYLRSSIYGE